jgi:tetratricopeptide (TPR) repeat protein
MSVAYGEPASGRDESAYREGLAHLQAGEWQAAIHSFEEALRQDPANPDLRRLIGEARMRADMDAHSNVRARRWIVPWRTLLIRLLVAAVVVALAVEGAIVLQRQIGPAIAAAQAQGRQATLLRQGNSYLEAENYDAAEVSFNELLKLVPDNQDATAGLERVKTGREILATYETGVTLQSQGQFTDALQKFTEVTVRTGGYRDANQRIQDIKTTLSVTELLAQAEADYTAQQYDAAISKYEQAQRLNASYQHDMVAGRLFELYMARGRAAVNQRPPATEKLPAALEDFTQALALDPRSPDAASEQHLLTTYLAGQASYAAGNWDDAIARLRSVFDERKDYLGAKAIIDPLYDAYIHSGDISRDAQDYALAWDQYRKAVELPLADTALARARMDSVAGMITPTPTPSNTPTPTPLPTATAYIYTPPTAVPSATPPPPLSAFRGMIVFRSDKEDQPGFWVMNPDGSHRTYLGDTGALQKQYDELYKKETLSPDGRYRCYVQTPEGTKPSPQVFYQGQKDPKTGITPTFQVTHLEGLNYDPVWSPDGAHIAFVGTKQGSDDIWTIQTDGKEPWDRTPNKWEWDKHPSWSPDSRQIVFWTNREGTMQIYIMDWDGKNAHNISKVPYAEYDPLWIK